MGPSRAASRFPPLDDAFLPLSAFHGEKQRVTFSPTPRLFRVFQNIHQVLLEGSAHPHIEESSSCVEHEPFKEQQHGTNIQELLQLGGERLRLQDLEVEVHFQPRGIRGNKAVFRQAKALLQEGHRADKAHEGRRQGHPEGLQLGVLQIRGRQVLHCQRLCTTQVG